MSYGWNTTKTLLGQYRWTVTQFVYGEGTKVLATGTCDTRAKAVARAKQAVRPYRRAASKGA